MKKSRLAAAFLASSLLVTGLVGAAPAEATATNVVVWVPFGNAQATALWQAAADRIEANNPGITVELHNGKDMAQSLAAINAGNGPDISMSNGFGNVGWFCGSGAWKNLNVLIQGPNGLNLNKTFTRAATSGTIAGGKRCAMPFSSEIFGFYYNKTQLKAAGFKKPPTTTAELETMAKKLTRFGANGEITRAGYILWSGYMDNGMASMYLGQMFGAKYYDPLGTKSTFYTDKRWAKAFNWQKRFIANVYGNGDFAKGSRKVRNFINHMGDEWGGTTNDFITGRVSMISSADWMTPLFCSGDDWALNPCDSPRVNFGVAGNPVDAPIKKTHYGSGVAGANALGISRNSTKTAAAWIVLKGFVTDRTLAIGWANLYGDPSHLKSARTAGAGVSYPARYAPFYDISNHPQSGYHVLANAGEHLDEEYLQQLLASWQTGNTLDIKRALQETASRVNQVLARNA